MTADALMARVHLRYGGRRLVSEVSPSAARLASLSASSFPGMPSWPAVHCSVSEYLSCFCSFVSCSLAGVPKGCLLVPLHELYARCLTRDGGEGYGVVYLGGLVSLPLLLCCCWPSHDMNSIPAPFHGLSWLPLLRLPCWAGF